MLTDGSFRKFIRIMSRKLRNFGAVYEDGDKYKLVEREDGSYYYIDEEGNVIEPFS